MLTVLLGVCLLGAISESLLAVAVSHSSGAVFGQLLYGIYGGSAEGLVVGERVQQFDGSRISDCAEHVDDLAGAVFVFGSREDRSE